MSNIPRPMPKIQIMNNKKKREFHAIINGKSRGRCAERACL